MSRGVRRIVFGPAAIRYTPIGPSRSAHIRAQKRSVASVPMCSGWYASHEDLAQNSTRCGAATALVSISNVIVSDVS